MPPPSTLERLRRTALAALLAGILAPTIGCSGDDDPAACDRDADCRAGERCAAGRCRLGVECVTAEECAADDPRTTCDPETYSCAFLDGFGDECGEGRPCAFGQFCSSLLGRCLDAAAARDCTRRSQCPANQICDRAANKCIPDLGCFGDEFCEPGEVCDLVNRTCRSEAAQCTSCSFEDCPQDLLCSEATQECLPVGGEPVCRQGETCDPLGRCVQCLTSDDCGPGTFCNTSVGRCESNIQCADDPSECPTTSEVQCVVCVKPEVCDRRTRRCAAPPEPCESDIDCPNDQLCDQGLDPPICVPRFPDCIDDLYDDPPNDAAGVARDLLERDGPAYDDLALCPGDVDWYRLDVAAGTFLTVDARFVHDEGDLELQLFLEDGTTVVDQSRSTTDNERVELEVGTDLNLLVRAFLGTQTVRPLDYRLVVGRDPGTICEDDAAEPNDGPAEAPPLTFGTPVEGRACPADPDWYALRSVPAGARIAVDLDFVDNLGDLDLELYRAGGTTPIRASRGDADGERVELDAPYGGDFLVRVVGEAADTNVYTLRASLLPGMGGVCLDDPLEPNDAPRALVPAESLLGTPQALSLCEGDEDWFEVDLDAFDLLEVEIGFDPGADLDLALYPAGIADPDESPLLLSNGIGPREYLAFETFRSRRLLVRVYGSRPTDASDYELRIDRITSTACVDDTYDFSGIGDDSADAVTLPLPPLREDDLSICAADVDWYQVIFRGGFDNVLRLQYPGDLATLDFELVQLDGLTVFFGSAGQAFSNHREVTIDVAGNGLAAAFVRVFSTDGGTAPYSLSLDLVPVFVCDPDRAEPNESASQASTLTATTAFPIALDDLTLCPSTRDPLTGSGDVDWFVLEPPAAGTRMEAEVTFDQGDLSLELLSPGGTVRACANGTTDRCFSDGNGLSELVSFTATTTEPYFLRVGSVYSGPGVLVRPPEADTPYRLEVRYGP